MLDVTVRGTRAIAATHGLDPTAAGTSLDLLKRVTMPRSLGDVVRESPGAQVISSGGVGAFTSLSLRGAAGEETLVLLDEIPLTTPDGGAFDLSMFPAELFQQVNVFRGGAPVWLGSGAVGGVLQLVPRRADSNGLHAALSAGSFGTYQLNAGSEVSLANGITSHSQLLMRGTQGDYPYVDDRGTRFDSSDDRTFKLKNADYTDSSGFQDVSIPVGRGTLHLLAMGLRRGGGFPGPAAQPTPKIRRESTRAIAAAAYSIEGDDDGAFARKLQLVASGSFGAERFSDHYGQLGTSRRTDSDNRSFRAFVRSAGSLALTRWLESSVVGSYAYDAYLPFDGFAFPQPSRSARHTAAGAVELAAHGFLGPVRYELRPSARIEWSDTQLAGIHSFSGSYPSDKHVLVPTARVGAVIEPMHGLAISASYATGTRLPAIFELFGDGGLVLPSLALRPVKSTSYDGGVTAKGRHKSYAGSAELRGFWQERRHSIAMYRTAQFQVGHENLSSVHQYGTEGRLSGELIDWVHLSGSATWLHTEDALGNRLPFRPRLLAYARPELRIPLHGWVQELSFASELWHRGFAFYDTANLAYTSACTKLGFGAALAMFERRVRFSARMDDALDARCTDLVGYPLQGRSVFFTLSFREVADDAS